MMRTAEAIQDSQSRHCTEIGNLLILNYATPSLSLLGLRSVVRLFVARSRVCVCVCLCVCPATAFSRLRLKIAPNSLVQ